MTIGKEAMLLYGQAGQRVLGISKKELLRWRSGMKEFTKKTLQRQEKTEKVSNPVGFGLKHMKSLFLCLLVCLVFVLHGVLFLLFI